MASVLIQSSLGEIAKWCNTHCLTNHPDKTEVMLLTPINFIGPLRPIKLSDNVIRFVSLSHSMGFTIDNQLNWIKDLATSMAKKVKQLRRFKSLPSAILESIYYKGILPSVTYGISVWGN